MTRFTIRQKIRKSIGISIFLPLALAGCEEGIALQVTQPPVLSENTVELIEVDVVAPEAFSITDTALWDGRPTFGGIWVAYPDIEMPERVRVRNDSNGKEVIAALYKREREFPGPKIELSADAATALSVLAGNPTELTIVALRRKTIEVEVEVEDTSLALDSNMAVPVRRPTAAASALPVDTVEIEETTLPPVVSPPKIDADSEGTYIQVATLQSMPQAETVVAKLVAAGLTVEIREREAGGKTLYRIVVGPANSPEAVEIMLSVVVELGYKDAIVLG